MDIFEMLGPELSKQVREKLELNADRKLLLSEKNYFVPRTDLNDLKSKLESNEGKIKSYEKQIEETKTLLKGSDELKEQYGQLTAKYQEDLQKKDKEILNVRKTSLIKEALTQAGGKHLKLLMKEIDLDKITLDNDNLIGLNDTIDTLKKDYEDLFVTKQPKGNGSGSSKKDKDDDNGPTNPFMKYL